MKIGPGDVQAFIDVYTAFARGERTITGRAALPMLASIYDALDKLTRPAQSPDGQSVRAPIPEGGELEMTPTQVRVLYSVAGEAFNNGQRFCDARRSLIALNLLERLNAEASLESMAEERDGGA